MQCGGREAQTDGGISGGKKCTRKWKRSRLFMSFIYSLSDSQIHSLTETDINRAIDTVCVPTVNYSSK